MDLKIKHVKLIKEHDSMPDMFNTAFLNSTFQKDYRDSIKRETLLMNSTKTEACLPDPSPLWTYQSQVGLEPHPLSLPYPRAQQHRPIIKLTTYDTKSL